MRIIDRIAREYPRLDMESIRILLMIYENPGFSISEIAEILVMDQKNVQLKIALMAQGRKERKSSRMNLVNIDYRVCDRRKRNLMLTPAGNSLAAELEPLTRKGD